MDQIFKEPKRNIFVYKFSNLDLYIKGIALAHYISHILRPPLVCEEVADLAVLLPEGSTQIAPGQIDISWSAQILERGKGGGGEGRKTAGSVYRHLCSEGEGVCIGGGEEPQRDVIQFSRGEHRL